VIIHGVPYFALIYMYARMRRETAGAAYRTLSQNWLIFLATLWALAYVEELFWSRGVWHERTWLFGSNWDWTGWKMWLVPLWPFRSLRITSWMDLSGVAAEQGRHDRRACGKLTSDDGAYVKIQIDLTGLILLAAIFAVSCKSSSTGGLLGPVDETAAAGKLVEEANADLKKIRVLYEQNEDKRQE